MLPVPGLDGRVPKKKGVFVVIVMRPIIFSEAIGFSLPSLLVNPALD